MKTVLFYGNFGRKGETISNGQTSKTVNFFNFVKNHSQHLNCVCFNTDSFCKNLLGNFIKLKALIKRCDTIVIFPGSVSSLNVFRIAYGRNTMPVFYPVVGGWIANKIKRNNKLVKFLKRFKCIYPETKGLADELFKLGIDNCTIIPTFTLRQTMEYDKLISNYTNCKKDHVYKIIYFGRITKSKGIYLALDAIKEINDSQNDYTLTMDYYGQFAKKEDFSSFSASLDDNIRYCGIMPDSEVWKISEYDFFIFPTFYHGEGMPACCIESLVFGTPIIASDWRFNKEIVIDGFNGFIFSLEKNNLKETIMKAIDSDIICLKKNAFLSGMKYLPDKAILPFINDLEEVLNK